MPQTTHTHTHTDTHARFQQDGWNKGGNFLCFMTIMINVQAIRHCHWRTHTVYCCTQGLGHINKCPVSFSRHVLFPLKQSCRDVVLCQLYLQLNCQSTLPCGECRQWNLQAPFPAMYYCRSTEHVFAFCSLFFLFSWSMFKIVLSEARKNKFKKVGYPIQETHFPCHELWWQSLKI